MAQRLLPRRYCSPGQWQCLRRAPRDLLHQESARDTPLPPSTSPNHPPDRQFPARHQRLPVRAPRRQQAYLRRHYRQQLRRQRQACPSGGILLNLVDATSTANTNEALTGSYYSAVRIRVSWTVTNQSTSSISVVSPDVTAVAGSAALGVSTGGTTIPGTLAPMQTASVYSSGLATTAEWNRMTGWAFKSTGLSQPMWAPIRAGPSRRLPWRRDRLTRVDLSSHGLILALGNISTNSTFV